MQKNDLFPFSVSTYTPCQSEEKGTAVITIPNEKVNDVLDEIRKDKTIPETSIKWNEAKNTSNPMILKLKLK